MMAQYHEKFKGSVVMGEIKNHSQGGIEGKELPQLNGHPNICWINMLGRCRRGTACLQNHVPKQDVGENFARDVCQKLEGGVAWCYRELPVLPPRGQGGR